VPVRDLRLRFVRCVSAALGGHLPLACLPHQLSHVPAPDLRS
jgi:hypothetical protein